MKLFTVINHQQKSGKIKINKDILKTFPHWKKYFEEIELINYQDVKVNIYSHASMDFFKIFKNLEFNSYLLEKEKKPFLTTKKYIDRHYSADTKILEHILFSKYIQEEHNVQLNRDVQISNFPKDFEVIADHLIYTYEKTEVRTFDYVFIIGEIDFFMCSEKDYFYNLYKFLKEEIYQLFDELEKNYEAIEEQKSIENNFSYHKKFSNFINEVEIFKANILSDFEINIARDGNHDYNYFLDYINSSENKFANDSLINYRIISFFTDEEIIKYLQYSFENFKKKYIYATIYDYFEKNDDFKFLASRIKEIDYYILGNNLYQQSYRPKDKFDYCGKYKNHLVYHHGKICYFFDLKYFDSNNIDIHFKHMNKIFDRESENLSRNSIVDYKGDGLEKKITSRIEYLKSDAIIVEKSPALEKIKIKGSLQSIGFLFSELIEKGFIEAPKRNGKDNTSAISRMIINHFEFIDKEEQPKPEDIRKTLFTENKLSIEKQKQFKIPQSKIINAD